MRKNGVESNLETGFSESLRPFKKESSTLGSFFVPIFGIFQWENLPERQKGPVDFLGEKRGHVVGYFSSF